MSNRDYFVDTMKRKEKAEEDRYFAQRDRELVEALRQRQADTEPRHDSPSSPAQ